MTLASVEATIAGGGQMPMGVTLDFRLVQAGPGWAAVEGTPGAAHLNPVGVVQGGYAAAILDFACGAAASTAVGEAQSVTALELKTSYLKAITPATGPIRAEGRVVGIAGDAVHVEAKLLDGGERLLAAATATLLIIPG